MIGTSRMLPRRICPIQSANQFLHSSAPNTLNLSIDSLRPGAGRSRPGPRLSADRPSNAPISPTPGQPEIGQVHAMQDGPWPLQSARSPLSCVPPGILARMRIERAARLLSSCPPGPDDESGRPALQGRGGSHLLPKEMRKSYLAFMPRLGV